MTILKIQELPTFSHSGHWLMGDLRSVCEVWLSNMKTSLSSSRSLSDAWFLSVDRGEASRGVSLLSTVAFIRKEKDDNGEN